jgi:alpha-galactosidase/6-phospho-beta-glucosidase family protein
MGKMNRNACSVNAAKQFEILTFGSNGRGLTQALEALIASPWKTPSRIQLGAVLDDLLLAHEAYLPYLKKRSKR